MAELWQVLLLTAAAGSAIPVGGYLAHWFHVRDRETREEIIASIANLGAGALLAAVVLVLIPDSLETAPGWVTLPAFVGGAAVFLVADIPLERSGTRLAQFLAMLLDYLPESVALGAFLAAGEIGGGGILLAVLITLQNLPEGFNGYRELCESDWGRPAAAAVLMAAVPLGPLAATAGFFWFSAGSAALAGIMMFASGGIVSLLFQNIIPAAHRRAHIGPTAAAILGFCAGLAGHTLAT